MEEQNKVLRSQLHVHFVPSGDGFLNWTVECVPFKLLKCINKKYCVYFTISFKEHEEEVLAQSL